MNALFRFLPGRIPSKGDQNDAKYDQRNSHPSKVADVLVKKQAGKPNDENQGETAERKRDAHPWDRVGSSALPLLVDCRTARSFHHQSGPWFIGLLFSR